MQLVTADEVAKVLKVKKPRVYELARQNIIPSVRFKRQVRFDLEAIEAHIRSLCSKSELTKNKQY